MTTELLYLRDAYLREFDATVVDVDATTRVALDRTAFYPTGGGQPHDTGHARRRARWSTCARRATSSGTRSRVTLPAVGDDGARRRRLGAPPRAHAHAHRAARAVRRDLERVGQAR